ncbi:rhomboid family intramembrane serine protease [Ruegeria marisrubri]|uniref:Rhomboid family intramembrane serine protease n=1 Tax=Ruegeria marisrubri TaxID=1685379 RepID=A0A0X3TXU8_9RHOB|nr:rhomboid family intramembrane serine protease [Ruegeria marisrubri]KUJ80494.1 rhomboid family intramembrane serine protease [Ruegeria marisrubri]
MIPIRDHNPSGRTPFVVYTLMAANILVFLSYVGAMDDPRLINRIFFDYAVIPARITDGYGLHTLVTSMFLHGGLMHLAGNMLFLWIFGDNLEDEMGHLPFLIFYLVCGIGAGLMHVVAAPTSAVPTIGASGAVAGVMGGYLLLFPKARVDILLIIVIYIRVFSIPAFVMLGVWLGMQFLGGIGSDPDQGGVAYWAHTGGFIVGLVLSVPLWLRRGGPNYWSRTHGHPPHPEHKYKLSPSRIPKVPRR